MFLERVVFLVQFCTLFQKHIAKKLVRDRNAKIEIVFFSKLVNLVLSFPKT